MKIFKLLSALVMFSILAACSGGSEPYIALENILERDLPDTDYYISGGDIFKGKALAFAHEKADGRPLLPPYDPQYFPVRYLYSFDMESMQQETLYEFPPDSHPAGGDYQGVKSGCILLYARGDILIGLGARRVGFGWFDTVFEFDFNKREMIKETLYDGGDVNLVAADNELLVYQRVFGEEFAETYDAKYREILETYMKDPMFHMHYADIPEDALEMINSLTDAKFRETVASAYFLINYKTGENTEITKTEFLEAQDSFGKVIST